VVSFTLLPLYPREKSPQYLLDRRPGGPQSRSGRRGEEKILDPTGTRKSDLSVVHPVTSLYTDCAIPAHDLVHILINFSKITPHEIRYKYILRSVGRML
jgi:hypothetical protein